MRRRLFQKLQKIFVKTEAGTFVLELSDKGLYRVRFPVGTGSLLERRGRRSSVAESQSLLKRCLSQLLRRFYGIRLDLSEATPFRKKIYQTLRRIPAGQLTTYGELARGAGFPGAARAVGTAMRRNRLPIVIPCHRVVPSSGGLGNYSAGVKWKRWLLELEISATGKAQRSK